MDIQHKYIYSDEIKLNQKLTSGYPMQQIEWLLRKEGHMNICVRECGRSLWLWLTGRWLVTWQRNQNCNKSTKKSLSRFPFYIRENLLNFRVLFSRNQMSIYKCGHMTSRLQQLLMTSIPFCALWRRRVVVVASTSLNASMKNSCFYRGCASGLELEIASWWS